MLRQAQHEGNGAAKGNGKTGIRKKRRHMRSILKEGLDAALRADPEMLEKCTPKTGYGKLIRGMILEAATCKATPLKTVMSLMDFRPPDFEHLDCEELPYDVWDWSADGEWQTMPEPEPEPASEPEVGEGVESPAKKELKRRLMRLVEAGQHEHAARIMDAIRASPHYTPPPVPTG